MAISFEIIIGLAVAMIVFFVGALAGANIISNYRTSQLIMQLDTLDRALEMYSKSHIDVNTSTVTVDSEKHVSWNSTKIYPKTLKELGTVRDEQSYFTKNIDISKFKYSTSTSSNNVMTYELGVVLPNGVYQKSKKSNK